MSQMLSEYQKSDDDDLFSPFRRQKRTSEPISSSKNKVPEIPSSPKSLLYLLIIPDSLLEFQVMPSPLVTSGHKRASLTSSLRKFLLVLLFVTISSGHPTSYLSSSESRLPIQRLLGHQQELVPTIRMSPEYYYERLLPSLLSSEDEDETSRIGGGRRHQLGSNDAIEDGEDEEDEDVYGPIAQQVSASCD
jgi:hypothetical protein